MFKLKPAERVPLLAKFYQPATELLSEKGVIKV